MYIVGNATQEGASKMVRNTSKKDNFLGKVLSVITRRTKGQSGVPSTRVLDLCFLSVSHYIRLKKGLISKAAFYSLFTLYWNGAGIATGNGLEQ